MKTIEEASRLDMGFRRIVIHIDWTVKLSARRARELQDRLRSIDHDADVVTVFSDGLRCLDENHQPTYWRKPLATLKEIIEICQKYGVKSGRGFWLPTGWKCSCAEKDKFNGGTCELGDISSCLPAEPSSEDWFTF